MLESILNEYPAITAILSGLGTLVVLGYAYVKATPSKSDDAYVAKLEKNAIVGPILKALKAFSPVERKKK